MGEKGEKAEARGCESSQRSEEGPSVAGLAFRRGSPLMILLQRTV